MDEIFISNLNPRKDYEKSGLSCLSWSIVKFGLIHYLLDIQRGKREVYIIIGKDRVPACKQLSWDKIPAIIIDYIENIKALAISLQENPICFALNHQRSWKYKVLEISTLNYPLSRNRIIQIPKSV